MVFTAVVARIIPRQKSQLIRARLDQFPAVALLGPRQAGKTTLAELIAEERASVYLDLEHPADREKLTDADLYLSGHEDKLVILDEVQRVPELFQTLRGLIDKGRRRGIWAGRFLLLGSASIDLLRQSGESLAGRIAFVELEPFNVLEVEGVGDGDGNGDARERLWVRGGFRTAFSPRTTKRAQSGARILSARTSNATFRSSGRACRRKRCAASGPCWPICRAARSTQLSSHVALPSMARRSPAISTCSSTSCWCGASRPCPPTSASAW